jgi:hypothetical protein
MERRRAVAIAGATSATVFAAVTAIAANFGLLGFGAAGSEPLGKLDAGRVAEVTGVPAGPAPAPGSAPSVVIRYEDVYLPAAASGAGAGTPVPLSTPAGAGPATAGAIDTGPGAAGDTAETTDTTADQADDDDDFEHHDREARDHDASHEESDDD